MQTTHGAPLPSSPLSQGVAAPRRALPFRGGGSRVAPPKGGRGGGEEGALEAAGRGGRATSEPAADQERVARGPQGSGRQPAQRCVFFVYPVGVRAEWRAEGCAGGPTAHAHADDVRLLCAVCAARAFCAPVAASTSGRRGRIDALADERRLSAKQQRAADDANAAFERELRGDDEHAPTPAPATSALGPARSPARVSVEVLAASWADPAAAEAEMVWSRLEAHFERHQMQVAVGTPLAPLARGSTPF